MSFVTDVLLGVLLLLYIANILYLASRDNTDEPKKKGERSGLSLYTDHGTGVQYVGTLFGGLTPRLGLDGKPYKKQEADYK